MRLHVVPLLLSLVAACRDSAPVPESREYRIAQESQLDTTSNPLLTAASGTAIELEMRIDGNSEVLTAVFEAVAGPGGMFAVSQRALPAVYLYKTADSSTRIIGRDGEGPGEFRAITNLGWVADTIWTWDPDLRRVSFFDAEGMFVRSVALREIKPGSERSLDFQPIEHTFEVVGAYADNTLAVRLWSNPEGSELAGPPVVRVSSAGDVLAILAVQGHEDPAFLRTVYAGPHFDISSDGQFIVTSTTELPPNSPTETMTTVQVVTHDGDLLFSSQLPIITERIPSSVADSIRDAVVGSIEQQSAALPQAGRDVLLAQVNAIRIPAAYRPIESIQVGNDGRVWIRLRPVASMERWLVLDRDGVASDTISGSFRPRSGIMGGDVMDADSAGFWIRDLDEFDVPSLTRYQFLGD